MDQEKVASMFADLRRESMVNSIVYIHTIMLLLKALTFIKLFGDLMGLWGRHLKKGHLKRICGYI